MVLPSVTLLASNPKWEGIAWKSGERRLQRCNIREVFGASTSESFATMPLERIVIEGPLDSADLLVLLSTLHPSFRGDVLHIHRRDAAFLSAQADGFPRVMYTLSKADIDFYVDVHALRQHGQENSFRLLSQPVEEKSSARVMRVLISENDRRTVRSVSSILSSLGCETLIANSAADAIHLVEQRRPDVLLLDGKDGHKHSASVARFVKNAYAEYRPRTIIVSASAGPPESGVDGYLLRPVAFDQVANAIFG